MRASKMFGTLLLCSSLMSACQCGGDPVDPGSGGPADGGGNGTGDSGTQGTGNPDGGGGTGPNDVPFPKEQACHSVTSETSLSKKPVDIIMVIDNSCSMTSEIEAVENNVNVNFAQIIEQSMIDYRVILLSRHGSAANSQSICIKGPLSGTTCNPIPAAPVNGPRFFQYDVEIGSHDSLTQILDTYDMTDRNNFAPGGWKNWLRPDSVKTFIEITDDESEITADAFENQLFALTPAGTFGDATKRNYIFHSIIGIPAKNPPTEAWTANEPRQNGQCPTSENPGARFEDLSLRTGGLRFPICETANYDAVFRAAAQDVIASAMISCEFTPPAQPQGTAYDQAYIEYTPGSGGAVQIFRQVADPAACTDSGFTRDATNDRITLCPGACAKVKADDAAKIQVLYACKAAGGGIG